MSTYVLMEVPREARGQMATKLLEAADELDLPRSVVRSKSKGFQVPEELHRYLFPSKYGEPEQGELPLGDGDPDSTGEQPKPEGDPVTDFSDPEKLTEAELDALTDPDKG